MRMRFRPRCFVSTRSRRMGRKGVSIIEFVVASSLMLAVMVGAGLTLTSSERSLYRSAATDAAAVAASNLLSQASIYRCQISPEPDAAISQTCNTVLNEPGSTVNVPFAGDFVSTMLSPSGCDVVVSGCVDYTVQLTSRWLQVTSQGVTPATSPDRCAWLDTTNQPDALARSVKFTWQLSSDVDPISAEYSNLDATPRSSVFTDKLRLGIIVSAPANTPVVLYDAATANTLVRLSSVCLDSLGAASGEVWFPFLPVTGNYVVYFLSPDIMLDPEVFVAAVLNIDSGPAAGTAVDMSTVCAVDVVSNIHVDISASPPLCIDGN